MHKLPRNGFNPMRKKVTFQRILSGLVAIQKQPKNLASMIQIFSQCGTGLEVDFLYGAQWVLL